MLAYPSHQGQMTPKYYYGRVGEFDWNVYDRDDPLPVAHHVSFDAARLITAALNAYTKDVDARQFSARMNEQ